MSRRVSLRARFVLVALACLLPLLAVVLFVLDRSMDHARDQLLDTEVATAQVVAGALASTLDENQAVLEQMAGLEEMRQPGPATGEVLGQFRRARLDLYGFFLVDPEGRLTATSGLDASQIPSGLVPPIGPALAGAEVAVSTRLFAPDGDVIAIAVPVWAGDTAEGQPVGAVGALLPVARLGADVLPIARVDTETVIAVLTDGEVIATQGNVEVDPAAVIASLAEPAAFAHSGAVGTHTYRDPDGAERLAAFAPLDVPGAAWAVLVTHPAPTTYGPNRSLLEQGLAALAVAVVATLALALLLGEWVARPLRRLTEHAAALTRGEFGHPPPAGGGGEIGALSAAFQEMATRLATQVHTLESAQEVGGTRAEELRELHRRTVRLQEDERRRIAGEIHDAVNPLITGALYQARALRLTNGHAAPSAAASPNGTATAATARDDGLAAVGDLLERAMTELHDVIFALRPPDLDDIGVVAAVERHIAQVGRSGLSCRLEVVGESPAFPPEVRLAIYRIVQEALHNALRHAGADEAVVRLETTDRLVRVTIADNGAGFDTDAAARPTALGLLSMRERAGAIGASFAITSRPGDGTRVTVERPIAAQADDGLAEIDDAAAADPAADGAPPAATLAGAGAAAPRDGGGS